MERQKTKHWRIFGRTVTRSRTGHVCFETPSGRCRPANAPFAALAKLEYRMDEVIKHALIRQPEPIEWDEASAKLAAETAARTGNTCPLLD